LTRAAPQASRSLTPAGPQQCARVDPRRERHERGGRGEHQRDRERLLPPSRAARGRADRHHHRRERREQRCGAHEWRSGILERGQRDERAGDDGDGDRGQRRLELLGARDERAGDRERRRVERIAEREPAEHERQRSERARRQPGAAREQRRAEPGGVEQCELCQAEQPDPDQLPRQELRGPDRGEQQLDHPRRLLLDHPCRDPAPIRDQGALEHQHAEERERGARPGRLERLDPKLAARERGRRGRAERRAQAQIALALLEQPDERGVGL